jgi:hypothetical protein
MGRIYLARRYHTAGGMRRFAARPWTQIRDTKFRYNEEIIPGHQIAAVRPVVTL